MDRDAKVPLPVGGSCQVLTLNARKAVQEEESLARLEFERIDRNNDGFISLHELMAGLSKLGYTDEDIRVLFDRVDTNSNAKIEVEEWIRYKVLCFMHLQTVE